MKVQQNKTPFYSMMDCYNQSSIDDSERSSFQVDEFEAPETKPQKLQQHPASTRSSIKDPTTPKRPQKKQVCFSEMSSMLCYEQNGPQDPRTLYYSKEDYDQFKADSYNTALAIRATIESSSSFQARAARHGKSPLKRYTQAYNELPNQLKAHGIDFIEVIGIEHLCVPQEVLKIALALRKKNSATLLAEQSRLQQVINYAGRRHQEELGPQVVLLLAESIKPITRLSRHLARGRAWNAARAE